MSKKPGPGLNVMILDIFLRKKWKKMMILTRNTSIYEEKVAKRRLSIKYPFFRRK
jgi:hypothetical protein